MSNPTIRVLGDDAERIRALLAEAAPAARLVGGDEAADFVALSAADLEDLIEDALATAAYHRTRDEESLPHEMVKRLLAGENRVRIWREHRGLTMQALAEKAEIGSRGYLADLESGRRQGTVETMRRLAAALGVELDDLV